MGFGTSRQRAKSEEKHYHSRSFTIIHDHSWSFTIMLLSSAINRNQNYGNCTFLTMGWYWKNRHFANWFFRQKGLWCKRGWKRDMASKSLSQKAGGRATVSSPCRQKISQKNEAKESSLLLKNPEHRWQHLLPVSEKSLSQRPRQRTTRGKSWHDFSSEWRIFFIN